MFDKYSSNAIGLLIDGNIKAGVIYEDFNKASVVCHIACEFLSSEFLAAVFDYPFNSMGVNKIIAPVASDNEKSQKLVEKMGFSVEGVLTDCHPNGDILLYTMKKSDCKYLKDKYGKKLLTAPGS
jgi:RimJ/RimL family protein N-acetyltransferase